MADTIYAPASAIGGAIAVIRISGGDARLAARILTRDVTQRPGMLLHTGVLDGMELIDDAMAVFFKAPGTYTGEDMMEIHCHGGMQTVRRVLRTLGGIGFRPAEGGEFTKRAFLNGKMDLSQAEAVMDVITAGAEQSLKAALSQLNGSVSEKVHSVENLLMDALSGIDAAVDYPDEAEEDTLLTLPEQLRQAAEEVELLLQEGDRNRVLRDGIRVVILGMPNVGKSSLLNSLAGEERAIVTSVAGTTRDTLDLRISIDGVPVRLIDTAGIRETVDAVEKIGVERAKRELDQADLVLLVLDGARELETGDLELLEATEGRERILIRNKEDITQASWMRDDVITICASSGEGVDALRREIARKACPQNADAGAITNERHLKALERAGEAISDALMATELTLVATDIHTALHRLGEITGSDVDDMVIDRIFSRFCVGK